MIYDIKPRSIVLKLTQTLCEGYASAGAVIDGTFIGESDGEGGRE